MASGTNGKKVVVLGGGPGGYPAAFRAADLGLDVTLVDPRANPGGVCLYQGCIPSKALLHVARLIFEAGGAGGFGIGFGRPEIDLAKLRDYRERVVKKLTQGLGGLSKQRGVEHVRGRGRFKDGSTLKVEKESGGSEELEFDHAIVATGSRPVVPGFAAESARVWTSDKALDLELVPKDLLVVGGGYIGLEMGTVYAALGSSVTVVEMTEGLLPGVDRDLVRILQKRLEKRFESIRLGTTVTAMKEEEGGMAVTLQSDDGQEETASFETVLVAVGRRPNTGDLGLDKAGVETTDKGFIHVDPQRRTTSERIFAIGDVAGEPLLAHKATHEGQVAAGIIAGKPDAFEPAAIPAVVFTDPELAWTGLQEEDLRSRGIDYRVAKFPWQASGRAISIERPDGLTKLLFEPHSERLLGAALVGAGAGELIAEATLAVEMGARADDLRRTIHPHPTLSETIMEGAEVFFGQSAHFKSRGR